MLKQGLVLYFFLMFGIGIFSLGFVCVAYARVRNSVLKAYVYYDVIFTLFIVVSMLVYYFYANFPSLDSVLSLFVWLNYAQGVLNSLLILTLPIFLHELFACTQRRWRNLAVALCAVGNYLSMHLGLALFIWRGEESLWLDILDHLLLVGILVYCLLLSLFYYKQRSQSRGVRLIAIVLGCSAGMQLAASVFTLFAEYLAFSSPILETPLFPLMYAGSNLVFGGYFFAEYWSPLQPKTVPPMVSSDNVSAPISPQPNSDDETQAFDDLCAQHQLSPREREVLVLLLHGQTNTQIAERLFISLNTAKTHISNIYQKIGVKRRYELLARCKDLALPVLRTENQ